MTGNTVNGSGNGGRSGAQTLLLLAAPLNVAILRALEQCPQRQSQLLRATGSPAQTTLRAQLKRLTELGVTEKRPRNCFPGVLEYELTATGHDLLRVVVALERWLARAPEGPRPLGGRAAKAAIKALAEGWSTMMIRALAARPLSLTQLDQVIGSMSYPSLERRLGAMRLADQLEPRPEDGTRGTPYAATRWGCEAAAPLVAAARWERYHIPTMAPPISRIDIEAVFLLAIPLLPFRRQRSGFCQLAVEIPNAKKHRVAGVTVECGHGPPSCSAELHGKPDAWALGSLSAWLDSIIDHDADRLELGGDCLLARSLLDDLHDALFAAPALRRT